MLACDFDLARLAVVQLSHAGNFREADIVAVLKVVPGLIQAGYNTVCSRDKAWDQPCGNSRLRPKRKQPTFVFGDGRHHDADRLLAVGVRHDKGRTKVAEDLPVRSSVER